MTPEQLRRWSRQIRLPQVGPQGQQKLAAARVAIVGVGGLGCPAALYLAAAGVGTLGLIDDDEVDPTNLQRQVLFGESDIGRAKVTVAGERLESLNSRLQLELHSVRLTASNALDLLSKYDIVVDGNDNFPTRYAVNDACVLLKKPNVYGSVLQFEGRASLFAPGRGPCYRCLYPEPPPAGVVPSCTEAGVLGVLPGMIGSIQAAEAIKWICTIGEPLVGRLLVFDMLAMSFETFRVPRRPGCAACGDHPTITAPVAYADGCDASKRPETVGSDGDHAGRITPLVAARRLAAGEPLLILDVREPIEFEMAHLPCSTLIPLGELPARAECEIGDYRDDEIAVLCHHGIRSAVAVEWLKKNGFTKVKNIEGGIDRWSTEADPSVPRY